MPSNNLRLSPRLRNWTYGSFGVLFVSGAAWWILQRWGLIETEFGPTIHPAATWLLRLHGAAAMLGLIVLGVLLPLHMQRGWMDGENRPSGTGMVACCLVLTITGWLLYYAGHERIRALASHVHIWLGVALPAIIAAHIWLGRKSRRREDNNNP